jgi:hypothetical protein
MVICHIQVITKFNFTLAQYYSLVKPRSINNENFLDIHSLSYHFSDSFSRGDAQFIGYYYREVIDENGRYYKDFPIPRFLIKNPNIFPFVKHKTFSLLPYQLIPYRKYSIFFLITVMKHRCIDLMTLHKLQEYIFDFSSRTGGYIELSISRIYSLKRLIDEAITKLLASGYYSDFERIFQSESKMDRIRAFINISLDFFCYKVLPPIRGPCALSYDYYLQGGGYLRNHYFLFGTPSQFRLKSQRG